VLVIQLTEIQLQDAELVETEVPVKEKLTVTITNRRSRRRITRSSIKRSRALMTKNTDLNNLGWR
jgi:hypothetical protein